MKKILSVICAVMMMLAAVPEVSAAKYDADDFVHAEGRYIIGTDGEELELRGMAMGNSVWSNPKKPNLNHHTEKSYKELSEMGFNCVRFYINYGMFEDDSAPYRYKKAGFDWIDKNIRWAKKYNMGIILNMHYPQGGYQSQGNGMGLWTDKEAQNRLAALWGKIAERYDNEPTIWGYGLINEPYVPLLETMEKTAEQYETLMRRLVSAVRSASPYQAIFVECLCNARDIEGEKAPDWEWFVPENTFALMNDDNIVYEFHTYAPFKFTHQDAEWAGNGGVTMSYPSDAVVSAEYENGWVGCLHASKKSTVGKWEYFESSFLTLSNDYNVAYAAVNAARTGEKGAVYFDDITVTEITSSGKKNILFSYDFENGIDVFYPWSSDGSGEMTFSADGGRDGSGALKISGTSGDFTGSAERFEMKKGSRYTVSGYIRRENTSASSPCVRLDYSKASEIYTFDRDYLESVIKPYAEFSEKHDVPVYAGEFGVIAAGFEDNRNGEVWVSDMIGIFRSYGIGFNYHTYHETNFGLYLSSDTKKPAAKDRNDGLADALETALK